MCSATTWHTTYTHALLWVTTLSQTTNIVPNNKKAWDASKALGKCFFLSLYLYIVNENDD